jgi:hypothetical protein
MVTIIVGPDGSEQTFVVHQSAISYHSPFFAAAFKSNFVEGQTQSMRLADVEEKIFGLLVHWIYTDEIEGGHCVGLVPAGKLWLLADWCMIPELQNAAILLIRDTIFTGVVTKTTLVGFRDLILLAYKFEIQSPLRKLLADFMSLNSAQSLRKFLERILEGLDARIAVDIATDIAVLLRTECQKSNHQRGAISILKLVPIQKYYVDVPERNES